MQNISDDELDKLFREAAEKSEPPFDPKAWEAMNKLLDDFPSHRLTGFSPRKLISLLIAVGVLIPTLYYFISRDSHQGYSADIETEAEKNQTLHNPDPNIDHAAAAQRSDRDKNYAKENVAEISALPLQRSDYPMASGKGKEITSQPTAVTHGKDEGVKNESLNYQETFENLNKNNITELNSGNPVIMESAQATIHDATQQNADASGVHNFTENPSAKDKKFPNSSTLADTLGFEKQAAQVTVSADSSVVKNNENNTSNDQDLRRPGRFGVKLALSPDFTSIGYSSVDRMGFNYGVMFEYQFKHNWTISLGSMLSKKIYSGTNVEYTFSDKKYTADKLSGECRIIDIPLNVYYYFHPENDLTFFAGLGITSYLMLTEDYSYTINGTYGSKEYYQEIKGENQEWFKQLNISIGVQKRLSNKLAMQVEPFLKAPLAGVGAGEVSLASLGAFLNVKYAFQRKEN